MKRFLPFLLSLLLVISLTACGEKAAKDEGSTPPPQDTVPLTREDNTPLTREDNHTPPPETDSTEVIPPEDIDIEGIVEKANRNSMSPEQIAELEADAAANGYEIEWQEDGSMVIVEDGQTYSLNNNWPDNEYTKDVPQPKLPITMSADDESSLTVVFGTVTKDEIKAYANELMEAGFTEDAETLDEASMDIYFYSASNGKGLYVELMHNSMQNTLIINK